MNQKQEWTTKNAIRAQQSYHLELITQVYEGPVQIGSTLLAENELHPIPWTISWSQTILGEVLFA